MVGIAQPHLLSRRALVVLLTLTLTFAYTVVRSRLAEATPTAPNVSASYYISTSDTTTAFNLGKADGQYDTSHGYTRRDAILDFGGQNAAGTGTVMWNQNPLTNAQVEAIAEQYADGYWAYTSSSQLMNLAIATNNSLYDISNAGGVTWAGVARAVWSSSIGVLVTPQITFWGGNDIETYTINTTASAVEAWAQGWNSSTGAKMVNFGDAAGCSHTTTTGGSGYVCPALEKNNQVNSYFYQYDYWYLSQGLADDTSVPQIYTTNTDGEWEWICLYGNNYQGKKITFQGPLSNYYRDNTSWSPSQSWSALWNALNGTACAQTPSYLIANKSEV